MYNLPAIEIWDACGLATEEMKWGHLDEKQKNSNDGGKWPGPKLNRRLLMYTNGLTCIGQMWTVHHRTF
jgi:hypothetical protein